MAGEAVVIGDSHRLRQISWNLLANATKFTPEHGTISVRLTHADDTVELTSRDTGQGIDPSFLPFIFEPFRQADSTTTRAHAGMGLGLALVRQLVEAHGGTVHPLSDGRGRGATMQVRLPAAGADAASKPAKLVSATRR